MTKINSRPLARIADVKVGSILVADGYFTCIPVGTECEVFHASDNRDLCITCSAGVHFLDGQEGDTPDTLGFYVGLELVGANPTPDL